MAIKKPVLAAGPLKTALIARFHEQNISVKDAAEKSGDSYVVLEVDEPLLAIGAICAGKILAYSPKVRQFTDETIRAQTLAPLPLGDDVDGNSYAAVVSAVVSKDFAGIYSVLTYKYEVIMTKRRLTNGNCAWR